MIIHCRVPQSIFCQNIEFHSLWIALTRDSFWGGLGLPWPELVLSCLNSRLGAKWPLSHFFEVKVSEWLWLSLTSCGSHGTANHCTFHSVEAGSSSASRLKLGENRYLTWELQTGESRELPLWTLTSSHFWVLSLLKTCWVLVPHLLGQSHLHCLRSLGTSGTGRVTWEKRGSWINNNHFLYFDQIMQIFS